MTYHAIAYIDGRYQCYVTDTGIERRNVGPKWVTPREASDFLDTLAAIPNTSPLRAPSLEQDELTSLGGNVDGSPAPSGALDSPIASFQAGLLDEAPSVRPEANPPGFWSD